jgi:DMSO/TMAO reductase YedYZ molybdopterin-dependent catalytic subunit
MKIALAAAMLSGTPLPAHADQAIDVGGQVAHPRQWTIADLQALPPVRVRVAFSTDHGDVEAVYTGALLWTVLSQAAPIDGPGAGASLRRVVLVTASDGYSVAVASGEIDPDFEGKQAVIAYAMDGKPIPQGLQLVIPGDRHAGRAVRDVAKVSVLSLGEQPKPALPGPVPPPPPLNRFGP